MSSSIQPIVMTTSRTIVRFSVTCSGVELFNSATFRVDSFDDQDNIVDRKILSMTPDQYLAWNNDDTYVIQFVATSLGYTVSP